MGGCMLKAIRTNQGLIEHKTRGGQLSDVVVTSSQEKNKDGNHGDWDGGKRTQGLEWSTCIENIIVVMVIVKIMLMILASKHN